MASLTTTTFAIEALAAGGVTLTAAQSTHLQSALDGASKLIRRWCGDREFNRATFDEEYQVAVDGTVLLRQIPVNLVSRVSVATEEAIEITNSSSSNQRASVRFATTGDVETGLVSTGLVLSRTASGVTSESTLLFATYTTITALAAAINALGNGWSATVVTGLGEWATAELVRGPARSALSGARFSVWSEDADGVAIDPHAGVLVFGSAGGTVRVVYDAGFETVPVSVQQACVMTAWDVLQNIGRDQRLGSETVGDYGYVLNTAFADRGLLKSVQGMLAPYRITR